MHWQSKGPLLFRGVPTGNTREWGQGVRFGKRCESGVKVPQIQQRELPEFKVKAMNGKV